MPKLFTMQNSFNAGVFSPTLARRSDITKYYNALKTGKNITLMPHGGCKRRAGTRPVLRSNDSSLGYAAQELVFSNKVRIEEFVFNVSQKYLIAIEPNKITIIKGMLVIAELTPSYTFTDDMLTEMDIAQYADSMIMVHPDFAPVRLIRGTTETSWTFEVIAFENVPLYDYTANSSGTTEIFTGDGATKEFTLIYSAAPFSAYVNGVQQLVDPSFTLDVDETEVYTYSIGGSNYEVFEEATVSGVGTIIVNEDCTYELQVTTVYTGSVTFTTKVSDGTTSTTITTVIDVVDTDVAIKGNILNSVSDYTYDSDALTVLFSDAPALNATIEIRSGKGILVQNASDNYEPLWSDARGYPKTVATYQGRLFFGGTKSKPISIFGSVLNDEFNFQTGAGDDDEGIFDTLSFGFDHIVNIHAGRSLQVFTESGEYYNSATVITPALSGYLRQTTYGSKRVNNIDIDGSTYFVDRSGNALRKFVYSFDEDSYVSTNVALLANHLFDDMVSLAVSKGTGKDIANLVYTVNSDGSMAVLNTLKLEDVQGWSQWTTEGSYEDCAVVDQDVYLLVNRNNKRYIEMVDENVLMDHYVELDDANDFITLPTSAAIGFSSLSKRGNDFYDGEAELIYDGDLLKVEFDAAHTAKEVGFNFQVEVETMDLNTDTQTGSLINKTKRIVRVKAYVHETVGIEIMNNRIIDRQFLMKFDAQLPPYTGIRETYAQGYSEHNAIIVQQKIPMPFTLLMLEAEIKY